MVQFKWFGPDYEGHMWASRVPCVGEMVFAKGMYRKVIAVMHYALETSEPPPGFVAAKIEIEMGRATR